MSAESYQALHGGSRLSQTAKTYPNTNMLITNVVEKLLDLSSSLICVTAPDGMLDAKVAVKAIWIEGVSFASSFQSESS